MTGLPIRRSWWRILVREVQRFATASALKAAAEQVGTARAFVRGLPAPRGVGENQLFRITLLDAARAWRRQMAVLKRLRARRRFDRAASAEDFAKGPEEAKAAFVRIVRTLSSSANPSAVSAVAASATQSAPRSVRARSFAARLAVHPATLRRRFKQQYGMSLREYRQRARVAEAVRTLTPDQKVYQLVDALGYSDEANLYRDVRALTGRTPGAIRLLAAGERRKLARRVASGK
jgi:AraC-like DNA-binding protein